MIQIIDKQLCTGCGACKDICPRDCIAMKSDSEGFLYPIADKDICVNCGCCEEVCPVQHPPTGSDHPRILAAINNCSSVRESSSSGGAFSALAGTILKQNGVVYGAAFQSDFVHLLHIAITDQVDISRLQGSKYLQSNIGDTYLSAKNHLEQGRMVLFTGTPCQITGLKAYLGKEYANLYTLDLICHGVPSPLVWAKYAESYKQQYNNEITAVSFRDKTTGWKNYSIRIQCQNGNVYRQPHSKDLFMQGFLKNLYLRPSCSSCQFKGSVRESDITLADFWGVQHKLPTLDDDRGTSIVVLHNEHGIKLWDAVKEQMTNIEIGIDCLNYSYFHSAEPHLLRNQFFNDLEQYEIIDNIRKYTREKFFQKCIKFIRAKWNAWIPYH